MMSTRKHVSTFHVMAHRIELFLLRSPKYFHLEACRREDGSDHLPVKLFVTQIVANSICECQYGTGSVGSYSTMVRPYVTLASALGSIPEESVAFDNEVSLLIVKLNLMRMHEDDSWVSLNRKADRSLGSLGKGEW